MVVGNVLFTGAASLFAFQVAVFPLLFKYSKLVKRKVVFTDCINYPVNIDYDKPWKSNIVGGRNFYVDFKSKVNDCPIRIGAWHIIPQSQFARVFLSDGNTTVDQRLCWELKNSQQPIVVYCHGNANHRAAPMRIHTYKMFQQLNFHVVAFDYRGYGDSTKVQPTEQGVVEDTLHVYSWVQDSLQDIPEERRPLVMLWGHSLGTAVLANMVANMQALCPSMLNKKRLPLPDALVLEAPFNNLVEEIARHPLSKLVNWLPYYNTAFLEPLGTSSEFAFTTDQNLERAKHVPILILHSEGDQIVPYDLAVKLHDKIAESRKQAGRAAAPLVFHTYKKDCGLGHNDLCQSEETMDVVMDFIEMLQDRRKTSKTPVFSLVNTQSRTKIPLGKNLKDSFVTKSKKSEKNLVNTRSTYQLLAEKLVSIQNLSNTSIDGSSLDYYPSEFLITAPSLDKLSVKRCTIPVRPLENLAEERESNKTITESRGSRKTVTGSLGSRKTITESLGSRKTITESLGSRKTITESRGSRKTITESRGSRKTITESLGSNKTITESLGSVETITRTRESRRSGKKTLDSRKSIPKSRASRKNTIDNREDSKKNVSKSQEPNENILKAPNARKSIAKTRESNENIAITRESKKNLAKTQNRKRSISKTRESKKNVTKTHDTMKNVTASRESKKNITKTEDAKKIITKTEDLNKTNTRSQKSKKKLFNKPQKANKNIIKIQDLNKTVPKTLEKNLPKANLSKSNASIYFTPNENTKVDDHQPSPENSQKHTANHLNCMKCDVL